MMLDVCKIRGYYSLSRDANYTLILVGDLRTKEFYSEIHQDRDDFEKAFFLGLESCQEAWDHEHDR